MNKTDPMWVFENYGEAAELIDEHEATIAQQAARLAELEQQRGGVVLPGRRTAGNDLARSYVDGWNACLDEVARLNPPGECVAVRRDVLADLVSLWAINGNGRSGSPNHSHTTPGIWDQGNPEGIAGQPCAECAIYDAARSILAQQGKAVGDE